MVSKCLGAISQRRLKMRKKADETASLLVVLEHKKGFTQENGNHVEVCKQGEL